MKKLLYILLALLAIIIGLYPSLYFIHGRHFRLLRLKDEALLDSLVWNTAFYTHITAGGLALLTGWVQFSARIRERRMSLHRNIGKLYVVAALPAALAGIDLSFTATGGLPAAAGFFCLGVLWLSVTAGAYLVIRKGRVAQHQQLMTLSYACCFSAVTLRLWLTALDTFLPFITAYTTVAWLSWVPNVGVALWMNSRSMRRLQPGATFS